MGTASLTPKHYIHAYANAFRLAPVECRTEGMDKRFYAIARLYAQNGTSPLILNLLQLARRGLQQLSWTQDEKGG